VQDANSQRKLNIGPNHPSRERKIAAVNRHIYFKMLAACVIP
jgi:hypothetical protein